MAAEDGCGAVRVVSQIEHAGFAKCFDRGKQHMRRKLQHLLEQLQCAVLAKDRSGLDYPQRVRSQVGEPGLDERNERWWRGVLFATRDPNRMVELILVGLERSP